MVTAAPGTWFYQDPALFCISLGWLILSGKTQKQIYLSNSIIYLL